MAKLRHITLSVDDMEKTAAFYEQAFEMKRVQDPHPLHWANFLDCVRTRKRPNSDIETCVRSSITSILGNISLRAGQRLNWDDKRHTVEQESVRPMLEREYRSPWNLQA